MLLEFELLFRMVALNDHILFCLCLYDYTNGADHFVLDFVESLKLRF